MAERERLSRSNSDRHPRDGHSARERERAASREIPARPSSRGPETRYTCGVVESKEGRPCLWALVINWVR